MLGKGQVCRGIVVHSDSVEDTILPINVAGFYSLGWLIVTPQRVLEGRQNEEGKEWSIRQRQSSRWPPSPQVVELYLLTLLLIPGLVQSSN